MHKRRLQEWSHGIKEEVKGTLKRYESITSMQVREELSIDQMEKQKLLLQPQKTERERERGERACACQDKCALGKDRQLWLPGT